MKEHLGSGNFPRNIAAAICNLTLCEGGEAKMVQDGAVIALRMILGHQVANNPRSNISSICVQALFNLTCVTEIYTGLETVIKALIALVPTSTIDPRSVTATACCNCSNFFKLRVRMLEAGAVQVLTNVGSSKPRSVEDASGGGDKSGERVSLPIVSVEGIEASKDLAYHAAVCFHNMATARSCRADMVIRGAASVMVSLSDNTTSLELLHCVAATLQKLALDISSRKRIIKDGAVVSWAPMQRDARPCHAAHRPTCRQPPNRPTAQPPNLLPPPLAPAPTPHLPLARHSLPPFSAPSTT